MRYVEPIKSFLLFLLVCLSLTLTVMIWNYKPNHQFIEETQIKDYLIGESKSLSNIVRPYRVIIRAEDVFKGTSSPTYIDSIFSYFEDEKATDLTLINSRLTTEQMNELMNINNRITLFSLSEIPLQSFTKVLNFESANLPEMSFDRIIIDLNNVSKDRELIVLFLNTTNKTLYRTSIMNQSVGKITNLFLKETNNFETFEEIKRSNAPSLFVSNESVEAIKYMYYLNYLNEIPIDQFKKALFQNENIVKKMNENATTDRYMDDMSTMTVDTKNRILTYVNRSSEGSQGIAASKLLNETYNYINDHGGFNADYRLSGIDSSKHLVEYQMFFQGYPVFSNETATEFSTTWGDFQVYKYRRPFFVLDMDIPSERKVRELQSGIEMLENFAQDKESIKDIVRGFYLYQNIDLGVFELEPAWFVLRENAWERIKSDRYGGMASGLE